MPRFVLNPCPKCGKRFDFPVTGCITFVDTFLLAHNEGRCPECGTQVVVDERQEHGGHPADSLSAAKANEEIRGVKIVDLDLSVRCRLALTRIGIDNLGALLQLTKDDLSKQLEQLPLCIDEIEEFLVGKGLK
jgi:DNA-directed RNA polymerase alpha subunit